MTRILKGLEVAKSLNESIQNDVASLKERGISPCLCIIRVGERADDLSYEKGAAKRAESVGVELKRTTLPADASQDDVLMAIKAANNDDSVHGILIFRPLPKHIDDNAVKAAIAPEKDVDGITDASLTGVFTGNGTGFAPCTAQACIEILRHFGIETLGKRAVVIGRSLVIGKPVSMMLLQENATVTICHTKTRNMSEICREADILIAAAGKAGTVTKEFLREGQTVIDVGINVNSEGKLCGDVMFDDAVGTVGAITPVPGGVGSVTTSVLLRHVLDAAMRRR